MIFYDVHHERWKCIEHNFLWYANYNKIISLIPTACTPPTLSKNPLKVIINLYAHEKNAKKNIYFIVCSNYTFGKNQNTKNGKEISYNCPVSIISNIRSFLLIFIFIRDYFNSAIGYWFHNQTMKVEKNREFARTCEILKAFHLNNLNTSFFRDTNLFSITYE